MKKYLQIVVALFIFGSAYAQAPVIEWQQYYGGSYYDDANSIHQTIDGGYIIAGTAESVDGDITENHGLSDYWLVKINSLGIIEWQKTYGGSNYDYAAKVLQTSEGGYIIAGSTESNDGDVSGNNGLMDVWIVKISSSGVIEWQKTLGGSGNENANWIKQTNDGGYIIAGTTDSTDGDITNNHGNHDVWIIKLSALGVIQWGKTYGGSNIDIGWCIEQTTDGGYILAGSTESTDGNVVGNHGNRDIWVVKLSDLGIIQWQKTLGGSSYDFANSVLQTNDGGYIIAGYTSSDDGDVSINYGGFDYWIIKLSSEGNIQWEKTYGDSSNEFANRIIQTNDGGYVVVGKEGFQCGDICDPPFQEDFWLIKLSHDGIVDWQKTIGGAYLASFGSFQQTADGGFIMASSEITAYCCFWYPTDIDYRIIKLSPEALATNAVSQNVFNIYPNPVSNVLKINNINNLPIDEIRIIDLSGKQIVSQKVNPEEVNLENISNGLYIIEIQSGQQKYIQKLIKQ
jgi:hypothetical protein